MSNAESMRQEKTNVFELVPLRVGGGGILTGGLRRRWGNGRGYLTQGSYDTTGTGGGSVLRRRSKKRQYRGFLHCDHPAPLTPFHFAIHKRTLAFYSTMQNRPFGVNRPYLGILEILSKNVPKIAGYTWDRHLIRGIRGHIGAGLGSGRVSNPVVCAAREVGGGKRTVVVRSVGGIGGGPPVNAWHRFPIIAGILCQRIISGRFLLHSPGLER